MDTKPSSEIWYRQYESELDLPSVMRLVGSELSEPYIIYTYRYFLANWCVSSSKYEASWWCGISWLHISGHNLPSLFVAQLPDKQIFHNINLRPNSRHSLHLSLYPKTTMAPWNLNRSALLCASKTFIRAKSIEGTLPCLALTSRGERGGLVRVVIILGQGCFLYESGRFSWNVQLEIFWGGPWILWSVREPRKYVNLSHSPVFYRTDIGAYAWVMGRQVVLETEYDNASALAFYASMGFMREKRLFRFYMNGKDAFRYVIPRANYKMGPIDKVYEDSYSQLTKRTMMSMQPYQGRFRITRWTNLCLSHRLFQYLL